jgi:hypothetical protein
VTLEEWQETSESWRRYTLKWQDWSAALLRDLGLQPQYGEHGADAAREILSKLARNQDCRAIAALEQLYDSLTEKERVESAGVVISRRIFEMREASCGR